MRNFVFSLLVGAAACDDAASLIQTRKLNLTDQDELSASWWYQKEPELDRKHDREHDKTEAARERQRERQREHERQQRERDCGDNAHECEEEHEQYDPRIAQWEALVQRAGQTSMVLETFLELPAQKQMKWVNLLQHAETKQIFHGFKPSTQRAALQLLQQSVEQSTARKGSDVATTGAATDAVDKVVSGKTSSVTEAATDPPPPPPPNNCPDDLATGLCNIDVDYGPVRSRGEVNVGCRFFCYQDSCREQVRV